MLPKNKNHSMLLSYRNFSRNLENELKLSVRRGLAAVTAAADVDNNESDTKKIDETLISEQMENISIDEMTSSDISKDYRAHFREHKHLLKDTIYTKKWWKAICCNRHLFKDKVNFNCVKIVLIHFPLELFFHAFKFPLINRLY